MRRAGGVYWFGFVGVGVGVGERMGLVGYAIGNYLYLNDWGETRRLTVEEAVKIALEQSGSVGLRAQELREATNGIIGYQISIHAVYGPLSAIGARYNPDTGYWKFIEGDDTL